MASLILCLSDIYCRLYVPLKAVCQPKIQAGPLITLALITAHLTDSVAGLLPYLMLMITLILGVGPHVGRSPPFPQGTAPSTTVPPEILLRITWPKYVFLIYYADS